MSDFTDKAMIVIVFVGYFMLGAEAGEAWFPGAWYGDLFGAFVAGCILYLWRKCSFKNRQRTTNETPD